MYVHMHDMLSRLIIYAYIITKIITVSLPCHAPIKHGRLTCPRSSRNPQGACSEPPQWKNSGHILEVAWKI